jgi:hypothetical protein
MEWFRNAYLYGELSAMENWCTWPSSTVSPRGMGTQRVEFFWSLICSIEKRSFRNSPGMKRRLTIAEPWSIVRGSCSLMYLLRIEVMSARGSEGHQKPEEEGVTVFLTPT